jgi:hypothetical protein
MSEDKDISLADINRYLIKLPGKICSAKIELEKKSAENKKQEILINEQRDKLLLSVDKKEYPSAEMRKSFADSNTDIVNARIALVDEQLEEETCKARYYKYVNFFQGVQERARNIRAEMKSLGDNA